MPTPTVVIGIGKGGCRMMSRVSEYAAHQGIADDFKYIGIDSNGSDLHKFSPEDVYPIELEVPAKSNQRDTDTSDYKYLKSDESIGEDGTDRRRYVARYFFDNTESYPGVIEDIQDQIDEFHSQQDGVNIWVLHSLGGGTGSGIYPILVSKLTSIKQDLDANLNTIGSLPRLDNLPSDDSPPEQQRFQANAYAALYELQKLFGTWDDDPYPIELDLESGRLSPPGSGITNEKVEIEERPVDLYWILGFDEERKGTSYREAMNEIAAAGVVYYSKQSSTENLPDDQQYDPNVFYALTSSSVQVPVKKARRYVSIDSEIDAAEAISETLKSELATHRRSKKFLNEVHDTEYYPSQTDVSELDLDHLKEDVVTRCEIRAQGVETYEIVDGDFDLESALEELIADQEANVREPEPVRPVEEIRSLESQADVEGEGIREQTDDEEASFDIADVVTWLYCDQLTKRLESEVQEHLFLSEVERVWNKHSPEIEEEYGHLSDREPEKKWVNGLEEYLEAEWWELDDEIDETNPVRRLRLRRLEQKQQDVDDDLCLLQDEYENFDVLQQFKSRVESKRESARKSIAEAIDGLDDLIRTKEDERRSVKKARKERERQKGDLRQSLLNPAGSNDEFTRDIPLQRVDSLSADDLTGSSSIAELMSNGMITQSDVARKLHSTLQRDLGDPVHDVPESVTDVGRTRMNIDSIHGVEINNSNRVPDAGLDVTGLLELDVGGRRNVPDLLDDAEYYNEEMIVDSTDAFSVRFFKWFTPVAFHNTSEFGVIHELFTRSDRDISEEFDNYTDEDLLDRFAYPDLFTEDDPGGERILEHFGMVTEKQLKE